MAQDEAHGPDQTDSVGPVSTADESEDQPSRLEPKAGAAQEDVRISGVQVNVSWDGPDGKEQHLDNRTEILVQYRAHPTNTLFIRLQFDVAHHSRQGVKHLYVFLRPQHLQSVSIIPGVTDGWSAAGMMKNVTGDVDHCLSVALCEPVVLVTPKNIDVGALQHKAGTNHDEQQLLALIQSLRSGLLSQKSLKIRIPRRSVPETSLMGLCQAASTPDLLKTDPRLDDLNSLYGGRGGQVISLDSIGTPSAGNEDCPPSYETAHSHPSTEPATSSKVGPRNRKRRRTASPSNSSASVDTDITPDTLSFLKDRIDRVIDAHVETRIKACTDSMIVSQVTAGLLSRVDQVIEERVGALIDAAVEKRFAPIEAKLATIQSALDRSQAEIEYMRYDLERDTNDLREETEDLLRTRFDEEISEVKEELHDYARAQVEDAKKDIIKSLRDEPLTCVVNMELNS